MTLNRRTYGLIAAFATVVVLVVAAIAIAATSAVQYDEYAPVEITQKIDKAATRESERYITLQFEELDSDGNALTPAKTYREAFKFEKDATEVTKKVMLKVYTNYKITMVEDSEFSNWRFTQKTVEYNNKTQDKGGNDTWSAAAGEEADTETLPATLKLGTVDKPVEDRKLVLNAEMTNKQWLQDTCSVDNTIDFTNWYHVTFNSNGHGNDVAGFNIEKGSAISSKKTEAALKTEAGEDDVTGLTLEGWYTDEKCSTANKVDLTAGVTQDMTLYANWTPTTDDDTGLNSYWIGPAYTYVAEGQNTAAAENGNYVSETTHVLKSSTEIQADIKKMQAGDAATIAEYTALMKEDKYHFYTVYKGADATADKDKFIEARIINVGAHQIDATDGNNDNSILTFQTTHDLPTALQMNSYDYNSGGWAESDLREAAAAIDSTTYFNAAFTGALATTKKVSNDGSVSAGATSSDSYTTTYDKFWVISSSEMVADAANSPSANTEGTVYGWYADRTINASNSANAGLAAMQKTRSGGTATGSTNSANVTWTRSPSTATSSAFIIKGSTGSIGQGGNATCKYGINLCFTFGKQTVNYDMNGHGDQLVQQVIGDDKKVAGYTKDDITGYSTTDLVFSGWFDNADCTGTAIDFSSKTFTSDATVYACWKATDTLVKSYWISPSLECITGAAAPAANANYVSEMHNIRKTADDIREDVAILKKGASHPKYYSTLKLYQEYMTNDNFHLYSKIGNGTTKDDYMEFRIINVGPHSATGNKTDGTKYSDGSALTFQATRGFPTAMAKQTTHANGWGGDAIRTALQSGGTYYKLFNTNFTNDIMSVQKWYLTYSGGTYAMKSTTDKFFLGAYCEYVTQTLYAATVPQTMYEGDQYQFWSGKFLNNDSANAASTGIGATTTRGGTAIASLGNNSQVGAERSIDVSSVTSDSPRFPTMKYNGDPNGHGCYATLNMSVVPCFTFGGTAYNVKFNMQGHGSQVTSRTVISGNTITAPTADEYGTEEGLKLEGWYTTAACTTASKVDLSTWKPTADTTLYANWVPDGDVEKYWIGPAARMTTSNTDATKINASNASYVSEETNVKKSSAEIQADVEVLKKGNVDSNPTYATVKAEYESFMYNDNYHLYTKVPAATEASGYFEFRIVNVLAHDNDSSALTFQAIHPFKTAMAVNDPATNEGGWAATQLRGNLNGTLLDSLSGVKSDIMTVTKNTGTGGPSNQTLQETDEKLWIAALSEFYDGNGASLAGEGSQYQYWDNLDITLGGATTEQSTTSNLGVVGIQKLRDNVSVPSGWTCWLRSPHNTNAGNWLYIFGTTGCTNASNPGNSYATLPIVPAFCFGGYLVQFDTQGGSAVDEQLLKSKTTATKPADPTRDGYVFKGWYTDDTYATKFDFATKIEADTTVYAKWEAVSDSYWLNYANAEAPEEGVLKTRSEIQADLANIYAGDADTIAEYTKYMNGVNGTAESEVHLYTKKPGSTTKTADDYYEFRLLDVTGNSEEPLTWQMTHVLPTAYAVDSTQAKTAWKDTDLASGLASNTLEGTTPIIPTSITDDAKEMTKGEVDSKLWVLSATEIYGDSAADSGICAADGEQYAYYANAGVTKGDATNECIAYRTRSGGIPTGQETSYDDYHGGTDDEKYVSWWTRDPSSYNTKTWCRVYNDGRLDHNYTNIKRGVAVAFTMAARVVMDTQDHGNSTFTLPLDNDGKVTSTAALNGTSKGLTLEGWYANEACYGDQIAGATTQSSALGNIKTLYANWIPTANDADGDLSYWIAPAYTTVTKGTNTKATTDNNAATAANTDNHYYVKDSWNVLKSSAEIKRDVQKIKNGDAAVIAEYTKIMEDDQYHLYTKYNGSTATYGNVADASGLNSYLEARIINVGAHQYGTGTGTDGSGLTFMATHCLPTAMQYNAGATNVDGWFGANCTLRTVMNADFKSAAYFNSNFYDNVMGVTKAATTGTSSAAIATGTDYFWLISYTELVTSYAGAGYPAADTEGATYQWFSARGYAGTPLNNLTLNPCSTTLGQTRNFMAPNNDWEAANPARWNYRSKYTTDNKRWLHGGGSGGVGWTLDGSSNKQAITPCFAF